MGTRRTTKVRQRRRHFIKEWRKFRGLTQDQLASRIGSATSTISQLETGKQGYSEPLLDELADALSCDPWELLNVDPSKEGEVVDLTRMLKNASPEVQAEAIGYVRGLLGRNR